MVGSCRRNYFSGFIDFNVKEYLSSFKPEEQLDKILLYNKKLKEYLKRIDLVKQDNELTAKLIGMKKKCYSKVENDEAER